MSYWILAAFTVFVYHTLSSMEQSSFDGIPIIFPKRKQSLRKQQPLLLIQELATKDTKEEFTKKECDDYLNQVSEMLKATQIVIDRISKNLLLIKQLEQHAAMPYNKKIRSIKREIVNEMCKHENQELNGAHVPTNDEGSN